MKFSNTVMSNKRISERKLLMSTNGLYIRQMNDRGGITIPPEIRKHLGLNGTEHVSFKISNSGLVEFSKVEIKVLDPKKKEIKKIKT